MKHIKQQILNCKNEFELRCLCSSLLRQGISNKQLLECFEELRRYNTNMPQDDVWLNVMDSLDGWCSIYYKIK